MNFFWKLYFSIVTITITCFCVGGYMLIQTNFKDSFKREVKSAYQENDILVNLLTLELLPYLEEVTIDKESQDWFEFLENVVSNITIETFNGNVSFCVRMESGMIVYQNDTFGDDSKLFKEISQNERGYIVKENKGDYKLQSLRIFSVNGVKLYFENTRNISELFLNRENQFKTLFYYTIVLLLISGMVIFVVTRWLVSPIKKLSKATKELAAGHLIVPVVINNEDEIGQLTKDFNTMAKRLSIMVKELQEEVERREMFMGNFAHELKTPLTSIIGYGDMLRSKRLSEEEIINYSNLIVEEGKRLEVISMKLLELIVLKKCDFKMCFVEAKTFFQEIENIMRLMMEEQEIDLIVEVESGKLYIEPDLMKIVCLNLLDNARKACNQNGKVYLIGKALSTGYQIIVKDNGCGIAAEELSKIKEAFYMVDKSRSRSAGGAGLGLALCEQIVELHHASISFESVLKQGTIVMVELKGIEENETK